jgi:hypothetical protein
MIGIGELNKGCRLIAGRHFISVKPVYRLTQNTPECDDH